MKELITETIIRAEPGKVWGILMDFYSYADWSRYIKSIEGNGEVGSELKVKMRTSKGKEKEFKPRVLVKEKEKEFRWKGDLKGALFSGEHYFIIEPMEQGRTRLIHGEKFTGLLTPMLWRSINTDTRKGFMEFNKAIKRKAESI
ncbi:MAG: SRPBCC domain-containing protein [Thermoplasmatota archaeon]